MQRRAFGVEWFFRFHKRSLFFLLSRELAGTRQNKKTSTVSVTAAEENQETGFWIYFRFLLHMRLHWRVFNLFICVVAGRTRNNMVLQNSGRYKADRGQSGGDPENQWANLSFSQRQLPAHDGFKLVKLSQEIDL